MINVALIGLGKMGISHYAILNAHPDINLVAVCDSSKFLLEGLNQVTDIKTYNDYKAMFKEENLDAVVVATPSISHAQIVQTAIDQELNIFCEKPFCLDPVIGKHLADQMLEKKLVGQVGYHYKFVGAFMEAQRIVQSGILGEIHNIRAEAYGPVTLRKKGSSWRTKKSEGGGCLYDYACHAIDLMNFCVGYPNQICASQLNSIFSQDVDDEVYSLFKYKSGMSGQLLANWSDESHRKMSTKILVWGKNGKLVVDRQEVQIYIRDPSLIATEFKAGWNSKYTTDLTQPVNYYLRGEEYSAQVDYFVDSIKKGRTSGINDFESATQTDLIAKQIILSAQQPPIAINTISSEVQLPNPPHLQTSVWRKIFGN